jgi:hypothetical protein
MTRKIHTRRDLNPRENDEVNFRNKFIQFSRIQVRLLKLGGASISRQKLVGNTTMNFQKFDDGWKIAPSHSSTNGI